jgi:hypothetical protein
VIHLVAEKALDLSGHLAAQIGSLVHHGEKHPPHREIRVHGLPYPLQRSQELAHPLNGVILGLNRDEHFVRCRQRVEGQQTEGRRTVN